MDDRSFLRRLASGSIGVLYIVVLGAVIVAAAGAACIWFITWQTMDYGHYVEEDTVLGGVVFALCAALMHGVFIAPALWRRRPFKAKPVQQQAPDYSAWRAPYHYGQNPFWESRASQFAPTYRTRGEEHWDVPTPPPQLNAQELIAPQPVYSVEETKPSVQATSDYVPFNGPTTLIGFPAAIEAQILEEEEKQ